MEKHFSRMTPEDGNSPAHLQAVRENRFKAFPMAESVPTLTPKHYALAMQASAILEYEYDNYRAGRQS